jgi:hypothetical protein
VNAAEDRVEVEFTFDDIPLRRLIERVQSFHRPNRAWQILVAVAGWLVLTFGLVGLFQLGNGYQPEGPEFVLIGFASGMLATILVLTVLNRLMLQSSLAAIRAARSRQGLVRIVLDADGVAYRSRGMSLVQSWENVEDVLVVQDVTLILPSRAEFYPVPHANLPTGVTPESLLGRIAVWRKQTEGAE